VSEQVKKSFNVEIERVTVHKFVIDDVNSPEEAELIADAWLRDGEDGAVLSDEITNVDSYPVEQEEIN
jgi:hypothetical protein